MNRRDLGKSLVASAVASLLPHRARAGFGPFARGGGSGGGALADLSWSATVTGSAKGAASGFIAPVAFNGTPYGGASNEQGARIYPVGAAQTVDVYYERVLGETGSISATISTFDSTNTTAGTHYTAVSQTLTWADGEIGWKKISVPVLSIPTGFGLIGITIIGSSAYRTPNWIWLQGTGRASGAKFVVTSNGINVGGNTAGSGTLAAPWQSISYACSQMGNAGGVLYLQNAGTHVEWTGSAGSGAGIQVANNCSNSNPLVILPDPLNSGVVKIDNGSTAGGSAVLWSNASAVQFNGTGASVWLVGMHFYRGTVTFYQSTAWTDPVIWQCEIDNYSNQTNDDVGGVFLDNTKGVIVQDTYIHECYSGQAGSSNSYTTVAAAFVPATSSFYSPAPSFVHCEVDLCAHGYFIKQASNTSSDFLLDVSHSLARRFEQASAIPGGPIHLPVQGTAWTGGATVRYSVGDATGKASSGTLGFVTSETVTVQNSNIDIINCVSIGNGKSGYGGGILGPISTTNGIRIFNGISQDSADWEIGLDAPASGLSTQLEISDYNIFVRSPTPFGEVGYGGTSTTYSAFASWQAASGAYFANAPDGNSTESAVTPSYANSSSYNYRLSNSGGRGNRPIGVGAEGVGIANNFLNSGLPVTA